ncbi:MAG: hypothetical protein JSU86_10195, partial [Phycisphaerales bacterium]
MTKQSTTTIVMSFLAAIMLTGCQRSPNVVDLLASLSDRSDAADDLPDSPDSGGDLVAVDEGSARGPGDPTENPQGEGPQPPLPDLSRFADPPAFELEPQTVQKFGALVTTDVKPPGPDASTAGHLLRLGLHPQDLRLEVGAAAGSLPGQPDGAILNKVPPMRSAAGSGEDAALVVDLTVTVHIGPGTDATDINTEFHPVGSFIVHAVLEDATMPVPTDRISIQPEWFTLDFSAAELATSGLFAIAIEVLSPIVGTLQILGFNMEYAEAVVPDVPSSTEPGSCAWSETVVTTPDGYYIDETDVLHTLAVDESGTPLIAYLYRMHYWPVYRCVAGITWPETQEHTEWILDEHEDVITIFEALRAEELSTELDPVAITVSGDTVVFLLLPRRDFRRLSHPVAVHASIDHKRIIEAQRLVLGTEEQPMFAKDASMCTDGENTFAAVRASTPPSYYPGPYPSLAIEIWASPIENARWSRVGYLIAPHQVDEQRRLGLQSQKFLDEHDLSIDIGSDGILYCAYHQFTSYDISFSPSEVIFASSGDGGRSWSSELIPGGEHDVDYLALHVAGGPDPLSCVTTYERYPISPGSRSTFHVTDGQSWWSGASSMSAYKVLFYGEKLWLAGKCPWSLSSVRCHDLEPVDRFPCRSEVIVEQWEECHPQASIASFENTVYGSSFDVGADYTSLRFGVVAHDIDPNGPSLSPDFSGTLDTPVIEYAGYIEDGDYILLDILPVTGADRFDIWWRVYGESQLNVDSVEAEEAPYSNYFFLLNPRPGARYTFLVVACNNDSRSPASASAQVTLLAEPVESAYAKLEPLDHALLVKWAAAQGADTYEVCWGTADTGLAQDHCDTVGGETT